eukprot:CAMPEP_0183375394 /NCGR_PEP_ID=MMETSP0164_2-20130417/117210_1 /TAXON_ID=221442 /ORGANISM="Coccolithus pelagicus ssp braarudi, Strain PLY182g" /LENGTH=83 /DNA_ID=CAMNT_0025552559 /DNA_START=181 /DNA_END=432 /DNA_ORIENTATION=-
MPPYTRFHTPLASSQDIRDLFAVGVAGDEQASEADPPATEAGYARAGLAGLILLLSSSMTGSSVLRSYASRQTSTFTTSSLVK